MRALQEALLSSGSTTDIWARFVLSNFCGPSCNGDLPQRSSNCNTPKNHNIHDPSSTGIQKRGLTGGLGFTTWPSQSKLSVWPYSKTGFHLSFKLFPSDRSSNDHLGSPTPLRCESRCNQENRRPEINELTKSGAKRESKCSKIDSTKRHRTHWTSLRFSMWRWCPPPELIG